jgi:hypothetical protein
MANIRLHETPFLGIHETDGRPEIEALFNVDA